MKTKRSLLTLLTIATIVLAMTVTAFAATGTPAAGSLTVTGGTEFNGKTVEAYQVFTASWVDANESSDTNHNYDDNIDVNDTISYVLNSAWNSFFSAIPTIAADTSTITLSEKAENYIHGLSDAQVLQLAKNMKAYAAANNISAAYTSAQAANGTATITGMTPGYYLVIPEGGSTSTARGTDATLVNVPSEASASWAIKSEYPTVVKTVDNKTETTAQIGEKVEYKLTSAVPDMSEYTAYSFAFHDTLSKGLTYVYTDDGDSTTTNDAASGITITINGTPVASYKYTVTYTPSASGNTTDSGTLDIEFINFKTEFGSQAGAPIVVTYQAMLNENAIIAGTGNKNSATVQYSNDPSDSTSKGTSLTSETKTYTYQITIDKHDDSATPVQLPNAVFKLKTSSGTTIKLIPTGTSDEYRIANADEIAQATNNQTVETVITPASGLVVIKGLEEGTYKLEEVSAPTGYNKIGSDITIVIAHTQTGTAPNVTHDYSTPTYNVDSTYQGTSSTINVVNTKGVVFPVTGGIGTIGLTALGAGIVIFGIVMPSRKKKRDKGA